MPLEQLAQQIIACTRCPRLTAYCRQIASTKKRAFQHDQYWGKPVPGFGDPRARVLIVGLAPAAHGANRTGRMFTGDGTDGHGSSAFLVRALYRAGYANQPLSEHRGDGLVLTDAYLTAIARCAPPDNRPLGEELANCRPFLVCEIGLLQQVRVIVALGKMAFDQVLDLFTQLGAQVARPRPRFSHAQRVNLGQGYPVLLGSYHPSRQNTQTGLLTPEMFDEVFATARQLAC